MPTRLPAQLDAVSGNFKCDISKCLILQQHLVKTETFRSDRTVEVFTIRHRMVCDSSNTVYLLYCNTDSHIQYIGETNKQKQKQNKNKPKKKTKKKQSKERALSTPIQYEHKHRHSCHQTFQSTEPHICQHEMSCNREGTHI